jgi:hypothetical protein
MLSGASYFYLTKILKNTQLKNILAKNMNVSAFSVKLFVIFSLAMPVARSEP